MPYKNLFSISNFLKKLITNLGIGLQKWRDVLSLPKGFPVAKHNKWMIRMAGLGPIPFRSQRAWLNAWAGLQPCSTHQQTNRSSTGFQEPYSENGHLRCENHTPVGKETEKIYKYSREMFLVSLDNRDPEKSMSTWARQRLGQPGAGILKSGGREKQEVILLRDRSLPQKSTYGRIPYMKFKNC